MLLTAHTATSTIQVRLNGVKKQTADARDEPFRFRAPLGLFRLPTSVDNRFRCSPVEDQGNLGSCTANAIAGAVEANENTKAISKSATVLSGAAQVQNDGSIQFITVVRPTWKVTAASVQYALPTVDASGNINFAGTVRPVAAAVKASALVHLSRLFQYYGTRVIEGTTSYDAGATMRNSVKAAVNYGCLDEALWPYDPKKFAVKPPTNLWTQAASRKVTSYHGIADGDLASMKTALGLGFLVPFGFIVYDSFVSAEMGTKGLLCRPKPAEKVLGGHAVCLVGYDDDKVMPDGSKGAFLVRNSWGTTWGLAGYFWMAYNYVSDPNLAWDFWVIRSSPF